MDFISVVDNTSAPDEGHKRSSSLGISEKHPHVFSIVGGLTHGHDIFLDKQQSEKLIQWLQEEMQTMEKYTCPWHHTFEANFAKCNECQKVEA